MMIKKTIIAFILFLLVSSLFSQDYSIYYITLSDKDDNYFSITEPNNFLTERSIDRRIRQNIDIDEYDLPVSDFYIDSIIGFGTELIHTSKWLNLLLVKVYDEDIIPQLDDLSFTTDIVKIKEIQNRKNHKLPQDFSAIIRKKAFKGDNYYDYGYSYLQIEIHDGQTLHNDGYRGQGMLIAVTDTGYPGVDDESPFDSLRNAGRIVAGRNFVSPGQTVYAGNDHGSIVLSVLAGNTPDFLIGSAPEADYILLVSEDISSETIIEEINWAAAAEYADSLGVDIINVSLGYLGFDDPDFDYTYEDMDGETTLIARAANVASGRGIIVVAAAGNSGTNASHPWIVSPGDAKDIITVGALNPELEIAGFSSRGPSFDGRVKPDVVAIGSQTVIYQPYNNFVYGYGTSFATPIISGLIACLWQKFPDKTNYEIMEMVQISSSIFENPNNSFGYGIPDFAKASELLTKVNQNQIGSISVFPNPFDETIKLSIPDSHDNADIIIKIYDTAGRILIYETFKNHYQDGIITLDLQNIKDKGIYFINISSINLNITEKIIKY